MLVDLPRGKIVHRGLGDEGDISIRPVLGQEGEAISVRVPFRNIGSGPAILDKVILMVGQLPCSIDNFSSPILAPGDFTGIDVDIAMVNAVSKKLADSLQDHHSFSVTIKYRDLGERRWRTRLEIEFDGHWAVVSVRISEDDS
jgi:hypothetical protein